MATPSEIIDMAASLMNDTAQTVYTDTAVLPYLNMALDKMQEMFEENNIPVTNAVSTTLGPIAALVDTIDFSTTPALPSDLIEIQRLWQSETGQNNWIPVVRNEFIPHYFEDIPVNYITLWAWINQQLIFTPANTVLDFKLDYIAKRIATPIVIGDIAVDIPIINIKSYLGYKTAALCAQFIAENPERADVLNQEAEDSKDTLLNTNTKGRQATTTRHRPFRAAYKRRGWAW